MHILDLPFMITHWTHWTNHMAFFIAGLYIVVTVRLSQRLVHAFKNSYFCHWAKPPSPPPLPPPSAPPLQDTLTLDQFFTRSNNLIILHWVKRLSPK